MTILSEVGVSAENQSLNGATSQISAHLHRVANPIVLPNHV